MESPPRRFSKLKLRREAYSLAASVLRGYLSAGPDWPSDRTQEETLFVEEQVAKIASQLEIKSFGV